MTRNPYARAVGKVNPPRVIEDKREKLKAKAEEKDNG